MKFGLRLPDMKYIIDKIKNFKEIEKAVIFGSRAKGTNKKSSDIDIAIYGKNIDFTTVAKLKSYLENGPMPFYFDIVDYTHLNHMELKEHIDRVGKIIYKITE